MIRIVWIAVLCWIGFGVMASIKVSIASLLSADASNVDYPIADGASALAKSDKLNVLNRQPLPSKPAGIRHRVGPKQLGAGGARQNHW
jgi:hypothetical protein